MLVSPFSNRKVVSYNIFYEKDGRLHHFSKEKWGVTQFSIKKTVGVSIKKWWGTGILIKN